MVLAEDVRRFLAKIEFTGGHWLWVAARNPQGYGLFKLGPKLQVAHRVSATWWLRELQDGEQIHHICGITSCVKPKHLLITMAKDHPGTMGDINRRKTHCPKGHPYAGDNLRERVDENGRQYGRACRACQAESAKKISQRKRWERREALTKTWHRRIVVEEPTA